jgi:hypothetical protein
LNEAHGMAGGFRADGTRRAAGQPFHLF